MSYKFTHFGSLSSTLTHPHSKSIIELIRKTEEECKTQDIPDQVSTGGCQGRTDKGLQNQVVFVDCAADHFSSQLEDTYASWDQ